MAARDFVSKRTRTEFREVLSGWGTLRTIDIAFENEDFTPDLSFESDFGGQRRTRVEESACITCAPVPMTWPGLERDARSDVSWH